MFFIEVNLAWSVSESGGRAFKVLELIGRGKNESTGCALLFASLTVPV